MKTKTEYIGNNFLEFDCDDFDNGQWLDTKVYFNGELLCVITGNTIDNFIEDFQNLINKYKI
jgi:hypothetical protein